jgi:hypothetical protein
VIIYARDPRTGTRTISAAHECASKAEALGQAIGAMVAGSPLAEVVLYTEYDEDMAGREPGDTVLSWNADELADPFPLEYEQL